MLTMLLYMYKVKYMGGNMPGFIIHLAVANEYIKKHKNQIENKQDFIRGCIYPDLTTKEGKKQTHFGKSSAEPELRIFLENISIDTDFNKGYFLHLITDYIFYNKILQYTSKDIYNDYDILNRYLLKKYDVEITEEIKDKVFFKEGKLKILNKELVDKTINEASKCDLETVKNEIIAGEYIEKWEYIRKLKRLD